MNFIKVAKTAGLTVATGVLGFAGKEIYKKIKEKKKKQADLDLLVRTILQENITNNLNPKLFQLREYFQVHWDDLMKREENHEFWMAWLAGLNEMDKIPAVGTMWNKVRINQLIIEIGKVRF